MLGSGEAVSGGRPAVALGGRGRPLVRGAGTRPTGAGREGALVGVLCLRASRDDAYGAVDGGADRGRLHARGSTRRGHERGAGPAAGSQLTPIRAREVTLVTSASVS